MKIEKRAKIIQEWIENYCKNNTFNPKALVIGISGGIDLGRKYFMCQNWNENHCFNYAN